MLSILWECVTALDVFAQDTERFLHVSPSAAVNWTDFRRLLHETGTSMLRCWSMLRSQHGMAHIFLLSLSNDIYMHFVALLKSSAFWLLATCKPLLVCFREHGPCLRW